MRRAITSSLLLSVALCVGTIHAQNAPSTPAEVERQFDAALNGAEMGSWMKTMAAEPNHVGSPHDKANAEMVLAQFRDWGWDAHIETFEVLYPTPVSETLELLGAEPFKATLTEPPIPGDDSSARVKDALPAYVAYQGDGDVTAPLVYVNYGMPDDYRQLERMGVSVAGKIVIARYGQGWRGLKPKLAQEHGAVGCIIYSDPRDDGYAAEDAYPKGPARPAGGFQRGSVADMTQYPGDPLTPGIGATADAKRLSVAEAAVVLKIPGAADFLWRRAAFPRGARRPGGAAELAWGTPHHLPRRRQRRRARSHGGEIRVAAQDHLQRGRHDEGQYLPRPMDHARQPP